MRKAEKSFRDHAVILNHKMWLQMWFIQVNFTNSKAHAVYAGLMLPYARQGTYG
jgi:hypothetical protein